MAGTAEGARKAQAKYRARILREAGAQPDGNGDAKPDANADAMPMSVEAVSVPAQSVADLQPDALTVVQKILRGTYRTPAAVRAQTALKVLEMGQGKPGSRGGPDPAAVALIGKLAAALGMRSPLPPVVVDGAGNVVPEPQSQRSMKE